MSTDRELLELAAQSQDEAVRWGVDWGHNGDRSCVSIVKKHNDGHFEVVAIDYDPKASPPQRKPWAGLTDEDHEEAVNVRLHVGVEGLVFWLEDKLREKNS